MVKNNGYTFRMGRIPVNLLFLLMLIIPITTASFTNEWGEFQDNAANWGFVNDESSMFNQS